MDHPSFGIAIVGRLLEAMGLRVGIISQPKSEKDYRKLGTPALGFFVTSGNIDSMVSHYTAAKRRRSDDPYTPGNKAGSRPDRAVIVYSQKLRELFGEIPIIIGGLEASFRRFAHYDYWDDAVRPSILPDSGADLLVYGMGEYQTREIARRLRAGEPISTMTDIRGTCFLTENPALLPAGAVSCASFDKVREDKKTYARAYAMQMEEQDHITGRAIVQKHGRAFLVQNPPMEPVEGEELDDVFRLPFTRSVYPMHESKGEVKAIEEIEFSIQHNRGCFGNCNFCSIAFHQGRVVSARSRQSVLEEAKRMIKSPRFKGYIHDVGGATANFRGPSCDKQRKHGMCKNRKCLAPTPCPNLKVDHTEYREMLEELRHLPGVKRVFVRSGLRFDYINADPDERFFTQLVKHHISGQLKVAPEHCSAAVLDKMGKPHISAYEKFSKTFYSTTKKVGKEQYLVPYLMSSHPGSTLRDAVELAVFLKRNNIRPEQVQDFYPTPGTASTCMFYTGLDPFTMEPVYVPRTPEEKAMQRALLQYYRPENRSVIIKALIKAGRADLVGTGKNCLVPPDKSFRERQNRQEQAHSGRRGGQTGGKGANSFAHTRGSSGANPRNKGAKAPKRKGR